MFFSTWELKCSADSGELPTRTSVKASMEDLQIFRKEILTSTVLIKDKLHGIKCTFRGPLLKLYWLLQIPEMASPCYTKHSLNIFYSCEALA